MRQRIFLLILDGAADRACPSLGGRTPLMYARTPNLDEFAHHGQCGLMEPLGPGTAPSSELAHFTLLGYDARSQFPGRGLLEALGEGLDPAPGEVVLRARLCLVRSEGMRLRTAERVPALAEEEARRMAEAVAEMESEGFRLRYRYTGGGDGLLFVAGSPDCPADPHLGDSDPFADGAALRRPAPAPGAPEAARRTAHALADYLVTACRRLSALDLPAVREARERGLRWALLAKWAGAWREVPPFAGWTGMEGSVVASSPPLRGLARLLGMEAVGAASSPPEEEVRARVAAGRRALAEGRDFVLVHTKAADEASHHGPGGPVEKARVLEALDRGVGEELLRMARAGEALVCVTSDHATPSEAGGAPGEEAAMVHGAEAVPFAVAGRGVVQDRVRSFSEVDCAEGMLGRFPGWEAMPRLLAFADRGRRAGLLPRRPGERPAEPPSEPLWDAELLEDGAGEA